MPDQIFRDNATPDPGAPFMANPIQSLGPRDARDPRDPNHPDHAMYEQIRAGVDRLDAQTGRSHDAASEQMAASLLTLAKKNGLTRVDDVVLNERTERLQAGELVFAVQGSRADPGMHRAQMATAEAARTPVAESLQRLEAVNLQLAQQQPTPQQQAALQRDPLEQERNQPRMG